MSVILMFLLGIGALLYLGRRIVKHLAYNQKIEIIKYTCDSIRHPVCCVLKESGRIWHVNRAFHQAAGLETRQEELLQHEVKFLSIFAYFPQNIGDFLKKSFVFAHCKNAPYRVIEIVPYYDSLPQDDLLMFIFVSEWTLGMCDVQTAPFDMALYDQEGDLLYSNRLVSKDQLNDESSDVYGYTAYSSKAQDMHCWDPVPNVNSEPTHIYKDILNIDSKDRLSFFHLLSSVSSSATAFPSVENPKQTILGWKNRGQFWAVRWPDTFTELRAVDRQRLEMLGRLTSNIVHDFNNLLTATIGFCDVFLQQTEATQKHQNAYKNIMQIKQNSIRAARFVQQLLLFASQKSGNVYAVSIHDVLLNFSDVLRRLVGSQVRLNVQYCEEPLFVMCDSVHLEQVVMNLCVNARDAMNGIGFFNISYHAERFEQDKTLVCGVLKAGAYVVLHFEDTGTGIKEENIKQIFEPFFSTKDSKDGTGLGLSVVCDIVLQLNGGIDVRSFVGRGTTITIYLPLCEDSEEMHNQDAEMHSAEQYRILLAEDEDSVRAFIAQILSYHGHMVLQACNGQEALRILQKEKVDLVISDAVMPGMKGPELVRHVLKLQPQQPILMISGFDRKEIVTQLKDVDLNYISFLSKPFSSADLSLSIHQAIKSARAHQTASRT